MTEIVCPSCEHVFEVDDYDSGDCPSCGKMHYYWDDDWNYEYEEEGCPGFYWDSI